MSTADVLVGRCSRLHLVPFNDMTTTVPAVLNDDIMVRELTATQSWRRCNRFGNVPLIHALIICNARDCGKPTICMNTPKNVLEALTTLQKQQIDILEHC